MLIDEQMGAAGKVARGRQVLNALWHDRTSGLFVTTVVTWQTLAGVQLSGNKLADICHRWYKVLKSIRVRPDPDSFIEMLTTQLKKSIVLAKDMECFEVFTRQSCRQDISVADESDSEAYSQAQREHLAKIT